MTELLLELRDGAAGADGQATGRWQDRMRAVRAMPGVASARHYRAVDTQLQLTLVEIDSERVVGPLSDAIDAADRSWRADGVELAAPDRRRYAAGAAFVNAGYSAEAATHLQAVWLAHDDPEDLAAWYADEHIPRLFLVPGWLRSRRFELADGGGPRFLALHDLAAASVATDPIGDPARNSPWRDRVMERVTAYERELLERIA